MKYRIKIVTYLNDRKEYYAQFKKLFYWIYLDFKGDTTVVNLTCDSREEALTRIDKHFGGNTKIQKIQFEYITK